MTHNFKLMALTLIMATLPIQANAESSVVKRLMGDAERGDLDAQYSLGVMYHKGSGVTKNNKEAEFWLQKVARRGDLNAVEVLKQIQSERRNYIPPDNCLSWFDGCNTCDKEYGCTKIACKILEEPKCLRFKK